jgi:ribosomal protein L34E
MTQDPAPALPSNSTCPRCGQPFRCGVNDALCHCMAHTLSKALRERLSREYTGCLCGPCLTALQQPGQ